MAGRIGKQRVYENNAEKQRAYRKRKRQERLLAAGYSQEVIDRYEAMFYFPRNISGK